MRRLTVYLLSVMLLCAVAPLFGQDKAVSDTMNARLTLLTQLSQSGNYEQAQVEADGFREFLKRHRQSITPQALTLISGIYKANSDDRSATRLLSDAELDARKDPNPETKAALLNALVKECRKWDLPDQALTCQQLLTTAQDSIVARQRRAEALGMQAKFDSLAALRKREIAEQSKYIHIEQDKAMMWGGIIGLAFLTLLFAFYRNTDRWRKLLERKEMEWDMMRTNLQRDAEEQAIAQAVEAVEAAQTAVVSTPPDPYLLYHGPKPEQIALLIEPNRQVVLYMKSLLSDRFQIETAASPSEGLQMTNDLLPDLVVCDAVLNGRTGIEIARQIKLSERTNHIPVVLLTDKFGNDGKLDALRAGADAWFTRPVIDDEFDASVQRLLDARKVKHEQFNRFLQLYFTDNRIPLEDPFLLRSVQMIEQNLAIPDFMADDIAKKMQLTKTHYAKKLKVLTGKEPVQLIREMRLEKSKVLLEKRAGTPQAIAELVGFTNPGTFSLAFKEYFGENTLLLHMPPRQLP
ncbi:MAG TPA: helix-turn-helix domain-containing protein, partial [Saprospiraceae bacterium]|nr:helix-turn-helix domain-containing protein [Saprospiraceae bacterium]